MAERAAKTPALDQQLLAGTFRDDDMPTIPPFEAVTLRLADLWG